jgi:uncharacterized SAM-binding protein YcdF (DUF218 family)
VLVRIGEQIQEVPRPVTAAGRVTALVRLVLVALALLVTLGAYAAARVLQQGDREEARPVDAIVVLGAAQYDGRPSPVFEARLQHAVALYRQGLAPWFVVTGGKASGDRTTEAAVAREYAEANRVPPDAIIGEDQGRNTLESLQAVAALLEQHGARRALFVSDRSHMLRVLRIADDLGIEAYGSPTQTSPIDLDDSRRVRALVHELGALAAYFVTGGIPFQDPPTG